MKNGECLRVHGMYAGAKRQRGYMNLYESESTVQGRTERTCDQMGKNAVGIIPISRGVSQYGVMQGKSARKRTRISVQARRNYNLPVISRVKCAQPRRKPQKNKTGASVA